MSMKNPMTPAGIEPATFRFVAQHLNHRELEEEEQHTMLLFYLITVQLFEYTLRPVLLHQKRIILNYSII